MLKPTTKQRIISYLRLNEGRTVSGSELEDQAHEWGTKASVISRRCRELVRDGAISKELSAKGNVQYRWRSPITIIVGVNDPLPPHPNQITRLILDESKEMQQELFNLRRTI